MNKMNRYRAKFVFLCCLLASFVCVYGQEDKQPVEVTKRKALVGPYCMVNQLSGVIHALTAYHDLDYITDTDLNNYGSVTGVNVNATLTPVLSVKDNQCIYKGGTTAGFSLVSTSGGGLLSLDVIKLFSISTYLDGKLVETRAVKEATSGGVGLNLIKIPGSDAVSIDVSIETTEGKNFDEIYLMIGGVQVEALQKMSIKYAFVGEPKEVFLTYNGVKNYGKEVGTPIEIDYDKCSGMPWPVKDRPIREDTFHDKLFDDDLTNSLGTGGLAIGEWFHAQIGTTYQFEAGTEVGFKYYNKGLLDLSLGSFVTIKLYDEHNKVVQTETVSAGLLGLGVIETGETITSITSKVPFYSARLTVGAGALSVNVGGVGIYYGFVREKPVTYHYCPIQSSMDAAICNQETTFTLMSNPKVNVEWKLESYQPYVSNTPIEEVMKRVVIGKTENGVTPVTGLSDDGVYTFKATALDCTLEPKCSETVVLRKGDPLMTSSCGTPLINDGVQQYELSTSGHGTSGSLISISDVKMKGNILDDNLTNYASYVSGLSIASNLGIIGIKTADEALIGTDVAGDKRVGFIVENASTFLDADVLQFLQIRLFRKGEKVYERVIDESNTVGVGLIGSENAQKIRYSIKVPKNIEFDEIQMWTSGVLNLGLNTLRIYYAFIESADENCSDPIRDGCSMIVSTKSMNASLSYKIPFEIASVAGTVVNAFHLLDDDMNTKMTYVPAAKIGGGFVLCIKLGRTIDKTKQLGFVLDNIPHLTGVGLANWMTVSTYLNGQETGDKFTDWHTLGLDVIGYGDRRYIISQPTQSYDEVRITFAGALEIGKDYNLYGLFFRSDLDGDGLPDCLDPECCSGSLTNLLVTQHLCEGDVVELLGQAKYEKENQRTFKYSIFQEDTDINTATPVFSGEMVIDKGIFQKTVWTDTKTGKYKLVIYDTNEEGNEYVLTTLFFIVHPLETTWSATTTDTDWNTWENWSNGSPWLCTNVIIPEQANVYPILKENAENGCNFIHFEANAEVKNTHNLDYQKAWVEMKLRPNRYYMVAAPLKRLYSGDWFIATGEQQLPYPFTSLVENNYPENRVTPTIYQRLWDATSLDQLISAANRPYVKPGDKVNVAVTGWTKPFNWLATPYDKNQLNGQEFDFNALSVWVHPLKPTEKEDGENGQTYTFRFPKEHEEYHYYDENGRPLSVGAQMNDRKNCGRFIYEREDGKTIFPIVMRFKNNSFNNKTFLVGNPFMTHINVEKLLQANTHISSVKLYDAETGAANSLIYDLNGDGILAAIPGDNAGTLHSIAPMQSFFVTCSAERLESCAVTFTEDMLETQPEAIQTIASRQHDCLFSVDEHLIRLSASTGKNRAEALIYFTDEASECYREHEDAEILLEQGMNSSIALFSIAEQHALDVEQRDKGGEIPLGLCLAKPEKVILKITVPAGYPDWLLTDSQTKRVYPLFSGKTNEIELGHLTTNIGRFYLKGQVEISIPDAADDGRHRAVCYWDAGGTRMVVQSEGELMNRCEVFSVDGRMVAQTASVATAYSFSLKEGLYVVKILFDDGTVVSKKII